MSDKDPSDLARGNFDERIEHAHIRHDEPKPTALGLVWILLSAALAIVALAVAFVWRM